MIDYPNNYKSSLSYSPRKGQEMDNNFIKILREMNTNTQLSVEEYAVIANLESSEDMIKIAYKAGYRDCCKSEVKRFELDKVYGGLRETNAQLILMQTAIPEFVSGVNGETLSAGFLGLHNRYEELTEKLSELI